MKVLLCGRFKAQEAATWHAALSAAAPEMQWLTQAEARAQPDDVAAAVVANPAPGSLQGFAHLRLLQSLWAGVEGLLADDSVPPQVPLARMVDPALSAAMAETALWATLALQRGFFDYAAQQRERVWQPHPQRRADELRVGVLGLGQMGGAVARRLLALGYRVSGWRLHTDAAGIAFDPVLRPALRPTLDPALAQALAPALVSTLGPAFDQVAGPAGLPGLLARSDILINLLPLTAATHGLLDARALATLPRGAALVNLARGAHVVEADLLAALDSGHLSRAVLDVFATEPLPREHPFWSHPRVSVLPHVAAATDPRSAAAVVAANLRALARGEALANVVVRARGY